MAGKPELLILTSSFPRGPDDETCAYVAELARGLSARFSVTVLAPADRESVDWQPWEFELIRAAPPILPRSVNPFQASCDLSECGSARILTKLLLLVSVASYFFKALWQARRARVILSHWLVPCGLIGAVIARLLGKPHIVVEHSGALHLLRRVRVGHGLARFIAGHSERVIVVSNDLRSKLLQLCPAAAGKIEVIRMGVRLAEREDRITPDHSRGAPSILFVGRLTEIKGVDLLIRAAARLNKVTVIVAGDGPDRARLEQLARQLSVSAIFLGRVNAQRRSSLFAECRAVVIPSRALRNGRTEGTPVVCLEAMAGGCVVVASSTGGLAEIVRDGHNGLLFEPDNHDDLARSLECVLNNPHISGRLASNAARTAREFGWPAITLRFERVIEAALRQNESIDSNTRIAGERTST
jgi:glycosyltransferase involved in cell wall biosynthesis